MLTGTVKYSLARGTLVLTHPGLGTLTFVDNCRDPAFTHITDELGDPVYFLCPHPGA